ncbi:MAG TPA: porin [Pyrinomonadaceae bacterium]
MKLLKILFAFPFCLALIAIAPVIVNGQGQSTPPQSEMDLLRRQLEEQKTLIQQLQTTIKTVTDLQAQQQQQIDDLHKQLEQANYEATTPTAKETPTPVPSASPPTIAEAEKTQQEAAKPETHVTKTSDVKRYDVKAGSGRIKFDGLLQAWLIGGNGGFRDTFRVRRAELKFTGELTPEIKFTVMIDPSKALSLNNTFTTIAGTTVLKDTSVNQASRVLQDAFITLTYFKKMSVNIGQFKVPLSLEGLQSSAGLDTAERALFVSDRARGGAFGDIRDIGVMAYGALNKRVDYQIGFFNGSGENQNDVDKNDSKAVAGRLVVRPAFAKGLQIGGSGAWGNGQRNDRPRRDRLGGEFLFVRRGLTLKSELMTGVDGDVHRRGYYGHIGYRFRPRLEGVFRVDTWDPDVRQESNAINVRERDYVTGFNYNLKENQVKFVFNYLHKTFGRGIVPSRNVWIMGLQTSW